MEEMTGITSEQAAGKVRQALKEPGRIEGGKASNRLHQDLLLHVRESCTAEAHEDVQIPCQLNRTACEASLSVVHAQR